MRPELHRPVPLDRIGPAGLAFSVDGTQAECAALAERLAIPAVASLHCRWMLRRAGPAGTVEAEGQLEARVTRTCVVSTEDFEADIAETFSIRFVPSGQENDDPDPESLDEIPYEGGSLDLGDASAEQLALALDPFPRAPGATLPEQHAEGAEPNPFAALIERRDPN